MSFVMKIAIGADHGGYKEKEEIKKYLKETLGHDVTDLGTYSTERCDYTDYALLVAQSVASGKCNLGILIDGAGIGSSIMANKVPGIRAACANEITTAINSREHNGANVLCMGSGIIGSAVMKNIVKAWLEHDLNGDRNIRRVGKIVEFERRLNELRDGK